jgi:hypothetical protein
MMTDGERLVWAASFALSLESVDDAVIAAGAAARAVKRLREAAFKRLSEVEVEDRAFLDEIVSAP